MKATTISKAHDWTKDIERPCRLQVGRAFCMIAPMPHLTRRAIVKWAAVVLLILVVAYPLSYAPTVRWKVGPRGAGEAAILWDGRFLPGYQPVDWLMDNTPFDKPLLIWSRLCGVDDVFRSCQVQRQNGYEISID